MRALAQCCLVAVVTVAGAAADARAQRIEWTDPPQAWPHPVRDSVRFGWLEVPVDHADPHGPTMRIALIQVPAGSADKAPDPVVSIAGGPGMPALDGHMRLRATGPHPHDNLRDRRDLIVIDPRGHGHSDPQRCDELDGAELPGADSIAAARQWLGMLRACRERLLAEGIRLETLTATQAADDLEVLRRALGAPQLNLIGLSYGTRIAGEAARHYPQTIRAVFYHAPVPPGMFPLPSDKIAEEVIPTLFARCAALASCRAAYPDLKADYDSIIARLEREPVRVRVSAVQEGVVDGALMRDGVRQFLDDRQLAAGAPLLIHTLAARGFEPVRRMAAPLMSALDDGGGVAAMTFLAFRCNDAMVAGGPPESLRQHCRALIGDDWTVPLTDPVTSDVPGLIVTGEFDPRTPPSHARMLASGLPRAHVVIEPWYGHERPSDCTFRMVRDFFEQPDVAPDAACLDSIPPIPFVTDVVPSRWVPGLLGWLWQNPWRAGVPAAALLLFAVPVIGIPVRELRAAPRPARERLEALMPFAVSIIGLTLLIGAALAVFTGMRTHLVVPLAGVTRPWAWLLALPWLLLALTAAALVLIPIRARHGGAARYLYWSSMAGAAVVLALWALHSVG